MAYLETYPVKNSKEHLPTWKLYNLCRLFISAETWLETTQHRSYGTSLFSDLMNLLVYNVPDLNLAPQYEEFSLCDAEIAIHMRFGPHLEKLKALRGTSLWHRNWTDAQTWHGFQFRQGLTLREGHLVFSIVNYDKGAHALVFFLQAKVGGVFQTKVSSLNKDASMISLKPGAGWLHTEREASVAPKAVRGWMPRQFFELNLSDLKALGGLPRGTTCRLAMYDVAAPDVVSLSQPFKLDIDIPGSN
jgi:hypothetical protein